MGLVPQEAWQIAIDQPRRGTRAPDRCRLRRTGRCGHARCWVEEAHVTELTALLRKGPGGDQLDGWPAGMRVFARRERPHPGAPLKPVRKTQTAGVTACGFSNVPAQLRGWRGSAGLHRRHPPGARAG